MCYVSIPPHSTLDTAHTLGSKVSASRHDTGRQALADYALHTARYGTCMQKWEIIIWSLVGTMTINKILNIEEESEE